MKKCENGKSKSEKMANEDVMMTGNLLNKGDKKGGKITNPQCQKMANEK